MSAGQLKFWLVRSRTIATRRAGCSALMCYDRLAAAPALANVVVGDVGLATEVGICGLSGVSIYGDKAEWFHATQVIADRHGLWWFDVDWLSV